MSSPDRARQIPASAYHLDGINLLSLGPGVMPFPDAAVDVPPGTILGWLSEMANSRDESQDFVEGFTRASYLLGADCIQFGTAYEPNPFAPCDEDESSSSDEEDNAPRVPNARHVDQYDGNVELPSIDQLDGGGATEPITTRVKTRVDWAKLIKDHPIGGNHRDGEQVDLGGDIDKTIAMLTSVYGKHVAIFQRLGYLPLDVANYLHAHGWTNYAVKWPVQRDVDLGPSTEAGYVYIAGSPNDPTPAPPIVPPRDKSQSKERSKTKSKSKSRSRSASRGPTRSSRSRSRKSPSPATTITSDDSTPSLSADEPELSPASEGEQTDEFNTRRSLNLSRYNLKTARKDELDKRIKKAARAINKLKEERAKVREKMRLESERARQAKQKTRTIEQEVIRERHKRRKLQKRIDKLAKKQKRKRKHRHTKSRSVTPPRRESRSHSRSRTPGANEHGYVYQCPRPSVDERDRDQYMGYIMNAWYETQTTPWPTPIDINWLFRCLRILPAAVDPKSDFGILLNMAPDVRLQTSMLIFTMVRVLTSTVFYAHNVTGINLHMFLALLPCPSVLNSTLVDGLLALPAQLAERNALLIELVFALIYECTGRFLEYRSIWRARWNGFPQQDADIVPYRSPYLRWGHEVIQAVPVLALDAWLTQRPIEWAISIPSPTVNIGALVDLNNVAERGFYARNGTLKYNELLSSTEPYWIVVYGQVALNVALQGWLDTQQWPTLRYQTCKWAHGRIASWEWPARPPVPANHPEYENLSIHKPLTVLSFDHISETVITPVLMVHPTNAVAFNALRNSTAGVNPTVGLFKGSSRPNAEYQPATSQFAFRFFQDADELDAVKANEVVARVGDDVGTTAGSSSLPGPAKDIRVHQGKTTYTGDKAVGVLATSNPVLQDIPAVVVRDGAIADDVAAAGATGKLAPPTSSRRIKSVPSKLKRLPAQIEEGIVVKPPSSDGTSTDITDAARKEAKRARKRKRAELLADEVDELDQDEVRRQAQSDEEQDPADDGVQI